MKDDGFIERERERLRLETQDQSELVPAKPSAHDKPMSSDLTTYRLDQAEKRHDDLRDDLRAAISSFEHKMDEGFKESRTNFWRLIILYIGGATGLLTAMARGFKWF